MMQIFWTLKKTKRGWLGVAVSPKGLVRSVYWHRTKQSAEQSLHTPPLRSGHTLVCDEKSCAPYLREIEEFLEGARTKFSLPLDMRFLTPFQQRVARAVRGISYGGLKSYAEVAEAAGSPRAARAVGQMMAHNPFPPVVPCHRVIASDGSLGGFGGGLPMKRRLIDMERKSTHRKR